MKKLSVLFLSVSAACVLRAGTAFSTNTFALVEVAGSTATNTIISIPWVGYTSDGEPKLSERVDRLVSPRNLTTGDLLLVPTNDTGYAAWELRVTNGAERCWAPIATASRIEEAVTNTVIRANDGSALVGRGYGIWLIRQNPAVVKDGATNAVPFYLYGQWTSSSATVRIAGGSEAAPGYTMLANPDVSVEMVVNDLGWADYSDRIGAKDTVILVPDQKTKHYCQWDAAKKQWYRTISTKTVVAGRTVTRTSKSYDLRVPAGTGFWYVRRTSEPFEFVFGASETAE